MFKKKLYRFKNAIWTVAQPLTKYPTSVCDSVSDLFVWRSSHEWQTFFELIDIAALFEDRSNLGYAHFVFFNQVGEFICEKSITIKENFRVTLNISSIVGSSHGEVGTFAVFHSPIPSCIGQMDAYLSDRGYVSYCYRDSLLKSYVHGNFDAVSIGKDKIIQFLGGSSLLNREYHLQYEIKPCISHELCIVNPTPREQSFYYKIISVPARKILKIHEFSLPPGAIHLYPIYYDSYESRRLVIKSKLVMARPLVFRIQNQTLDVFHG